MARAGARMIRAPHPMARTHKALAAGLVAVTALLSSEGWLRGERAFARADYAAAAAAWGAWWPGSVGSDNSSSSSSSLLAPVSWW